MCNVIERINKLIIPKLDSLWKHANWKKSTIAVVGVMARNFYYLKSNQHVFNDKFYVQRSKDYV